MRQSRMSGRDPHTTTQCIRLGKTEAVNREDCMQTGRLNLVLRFGIKPNSLCTATPHKLQKNAQI